MSESLSRVNDLINASLLIDASSRDDDALMMPQEIAAENLSAEAQEAARILSSFTSPAKEAEPKREAAKREAPKRVAPPEPAASPKIAAPKKGKAKHKKRDTDLAFLPSYSGKKVSPKLPLGPRTPRYQSELVDSTGQYRPDGMKIIRRMTKVQLNKLINDACDGSPGAMLDTATIYLMGYCGFSVDIEAAFDYLNKIVSLPFDIHHNVATSLLSDYYRFDNDPKYVCKAVQALSEKERRAKIFSLRKEAATNGLLHAINALGLCYEENIGVPEAEFTEAKLKTEAEITLYRQRKAYELYEKAAKEGYAIAEFNLALCYQIEKDKKPFYVPEEYNSPEKRKEQMKYWAGRAARKDHPEARKLYESILAEGKKEKEKSSLPKVPKVPKVKTSVKNKSDYLIPKKRRKRKRKDIESEVESLAALNPSLSLNANPAKDKGEKDAEMKNKKEVVASKQDVAATLAEMLQAFKVLKSTESQLAERTEVLLTHQYSQIEQLGFTADMLEKANQADDKEIRELEEQIKSLKNPSLSLGMTD